jgi:uncharacterized protein YcnI
MRLAQTAIALAVALLPLAFAHAVVRTDLGAAESKAGASETYRLQVPVEKNLATTEVRLIVPDGFRLSRFQQTPGWTRSVLTDTNGRISEVTWKGELSPGEFQRFVFQGTNPAAAGSLVWKVYQKHADGSTTAWDDTSPETPASRVEIR